MDDDLERDAEMAAALMLIPFMGATKMMRANMEFLADLREMPLENIVHNLRDRKIN